MSHNDPHSQREAAKYDNPIASREYILTLFEQLKAPHTTKALAKVLKYQDKEQIFALKCRLKAMVSDGQLTINKFKQFEIPTASKVMTGKIVGHRDGYGFFVPDNGSKDLFIPSQEMQRVLHGDIVEAMAAPLMDKKGRREARILDVIESRKAFIVGRFFLEKNIAFIVPEDKRIAQDIIIPQDQRLGARQGQIVTVEIIQRPSKRTNAVGRVVEVLGDHLAPGMEIEIALREHDLPHQWPQAVEDELQQWADEVDDAASAGRVDLRSLPLVTIDGEDARDFDDAVYCQANPSGGWRLWVAIADVSYYVRPGTALDDEALIRGNSVYFPSQVIPMLPEKLSNGLCSLNPDVDRLCMVCEMTVTSTGKLSGSKFYPAVMRSHARFTYTKVAAILDGDKELRERYQERVNDLEQLHKLYHALVGARQRRGAIEFETQESRFIFNADRKIESIEAVVRNDAHKIIEECMILANVATAKFVEKHEFPGIFRVHDQPNEEKYRNFVRYLAELGIEVPFKETPEPADYGAILAKVAERPDAELIQTMLLRSMKQAVYQHDNLGHFGLALPEYSHFTSPIRRYPDLIIHRIIKAILESQQNDPVNIGCYSYPADALVELGEHCSMTERRADDATRDVADWLKCEFMQDHVGMEFEGVISTVTGFGFFVRLNDLHIEGLVHISSLPRDYYAFDEMRMRLVGEHSRRKFHVGDVVAVKVAAVTLDEKKIDLVLAEQSGDNKAAATGGKLKPQSTKKKPNDGQYQGRRGRGKPERAAKQGKKDKKVKSKVKKRGARKQRPGKNERNKQKRKSS